MAKYRIIETKCRSATEGVCLAPFSLERMQSDGVSYWPIGVYDTFEGAERGLNAVMNQTI